MKKTWYRLDDQVIVQANEDTQKYILGKIIGAEWTTTKKKWFYTVRGLNLSTIEISYYYEDVLLKNQSTLIKVK